jgi:hypothetical protein
LSEQRPEEKDQTQPDDQAEEDEVKEILEGLEQLGPEQDPAGMELEKVKRGAETEPDLEQKKKAVRLDDRQEESVRRNLMQDLGGSTYRRLKEQTQHPWPAPYQRPALQEADYHVEEAFFATPGDDYLKEAVEISLDVFAEELTQVRGLERAIEACYATSVAKKRKVEVRLKGLDDKEKLAFRGAKKKEFSQWLSNKVLELASTRGIPRSRIIRCRWVLTFKDSEPDDKADILKVLDYAGVPNQDVDEKFSNLGDGRTAKARLVILGYEDPDLGTFFNLLSYSPKGEQDAGVMCRLPQRLGHQITGC